MASAGVVQLFEASSSLLKGGGFHSLTGHIPRYRVLSTLEVHTDVFLLVPYTFLELLF